MKKLNKTLTFMLVTAMACMGAVTVLAAEDIPPMGYDTPETVANDSIDTNETPIFSIQDYQEMSDEMAVPTDNFRNSPAFGTTRGGVVVVDGEARTTAAEIEYEEDDAEEVAAIPENEVPKDDAPTNKAADAETTSEDAAEGTEEAVVTSDNQPNPNTGRVSTIAPIVMALAAAVAGSALMLKGKKQ